MIKFVKTTVMDEIEEFEILMESLGLNLTVEELEDAKKIFLKDFKQDTEWAGQGVPVPIPSTNFRAYAITSCVTGLYTRDLLSSKSSVMRHS